MDSERQTDTQASRNGVREMESEKKKAETHTHTQAHTHTRTQACGSQDQGRKEPLSTTHGSWESELLGCYTGPHQPSCSKCGPGARTGDAHPGSRETCRPSPDDSIRMCILT